MSDRDFVGFLALVPNAAKDGYLGAVLVVDTMGRPVEFRVTYPIKPTAIQRVLYGNALEPYIGAELCGKPLLKSTTHELALMLVDRESLLSVSQDAVTPFAYICPQGERLEVMDGMEAQGTRRSIGSSSGRFRPIEATFAKSAEAAADDVTSLIERLYADIDLLEPFERIAKAVESLAAQDTRFR